MSAGCGSSACDNCLVRPWLLARLAAHLDVVRARIAPILELPDAELIEAVAGGARVAVQSELHGFDPAAARERADRAGLELICSCDPGYPSALRALRNPPAVLHIAGTAGRFSRLVAELPAAVVGARRASAYGLEVAGTLGRSLGATGITVLSGMALGIDSAAHAGALAAGGPTVAVVPGGADRPYPPSKHALRRRIRETGALVSELPANTPVRSWMFPARNRIIAALAEITVVVEATERSGALITADFARELGRTVAAVPGRVSSRLAAGPNGLLAAGAVLVRNGQDILDELFGPGARRAPAAADRAALSSDLMRLLDAVADGADTPAALARAGFAVEHALAALASLELGGYVRRGAGGRFVPIE